MLEEEREFGDQNTISLHKCSSKCVPKELSALATVSPLQLHESVTAMQRFKGTNVGSNLVSQFQNPTVVDMETLSDICFCTKEKFHGVDVSSHMIPILQKIWDKHGNIIQGHVLHSDSFLTCTLESLAKIIIILQSDSGKSLNDSQAKYLNSTLLDLRSMHLKLEWLVPFVEKALVLHKEKITMELEMVESELEAELCEVKRRLVEQRKLVSESQLVSTPFDVKDVLSKGHIHFIQGCSSNI
ncbi:uncharacterized protein [Spinacia oleracea]|uniref:MATH domain-containing protein n=1 Tax=Spinacia oleracea TaxID=3562 RepID=A0ABM3QLZ9_SPIOL|nr:uncharacterized protein LOC110805051 [Spinacia oleracea]